MPAGRPRKPLSILKQEGKSHLSKKEIEIRKKSEVNIGTKELVAPAYVKKDLVAFKKWQEILDNYKDADFISSGDVGFLARYCMTFSEYLRLCETRDRLGNLQANWDQYEDVIPEEFQESIEKALSMNVDLQLENAINKKMDLLIKMEDRSFLNPLAKIKGIPVKEKPKPKTDLERKGFGNV
jgi:phage terminase small subunit